MVTFFRALGGAAVDFFRHGCATLAASIAFFALLSLLPMVFLLLYVIGLFVSHDIGHEYVLTFMQSFHPNMWPQLEGEIARVAGEKAVRWVVLVTFVWFASLVFYEVEYAVQVVFGTAEKRNPVIGSLRSIALLGLLGVLLCLSFLATQIMNELVSLAPQIGGLDVIVSAASQFLLSYLLPFVLLLVSVTCLYRYLPQTRPAWREAFLGGLFLTLLWELAKHLFTSYVQNLGVYGRMYGSLLTLVLFLLWIYYSAALFLFSAALVHRLHLMSEERRTRRMFPTVLPSSPPDDVAPESLPVPRGEPELAGTWARSWDSEREQ